ncbi:MAG: hypothetical protein U9R37_05885 [Campylobacterota bacterium]|nr:hypothetical protein [Campylobacterota bacterium]
MKNNILNYGLPILLIFLFAILFSIVKIMYKCPSCNFSIKEDIHIKKLLSQVEFSDEANIIEHFEYITDFKDKKRDNAN